MSEAPLTHTSAAATPTTRHTPTTYLLWAVGLLLLALLTWRMVDNNDSRPAVGRPAPDFDIVFYDGYAWETRPQMRLSDFRGQVVVLNFWASWCVECRDEAPMLEDLWRQYADRGVVLLGLAYSDTDTKAHAYLESFGVTYPNAPDLRLKASDAYGLTGVPETFIIGPDGAIAFMRIGPVTAPELTSVLESLLADGQS